MYSSIVLFSAVQQGKSPELAGDLDRFLFNTIIMKNTREVSCEDMQTMSTLIVRTHMEEWHKHEPAHAFSTSAYV